MIAYMIYAMFDCLYYVYTQSFRDMQLLTMEEATVYEKKEKARKTLSVLQSQVHI